MNMVFPCDKPKTICNRIICALAWIGFALAVIIVIGGLVLGIGCLFDWWSIQISVKLI